MAIKYSDRHTYIYNKLEKIFKKIGKHYTEMELGDSIHIKNDGYMDLVVSRITDNIISLEHNYVQNGDLMVDPRIDVRIFEHSDDLKMAEAMTFENSSLGIYQEVYFEKEGKRYINTRLKNDLNGFLHGWLVNMERQGFYK
jgi:hypothetical protein